MVISKKFLKVKIDCIPGIVLSEFVLTYELPLISYNTRLLDGLQLGQSRLMGFLDETFQWSIYCDISYFSWMSLGILSLLSNFVILQSECWKVPWLSLFQWDNFHRSRPDGNIDSSQLFFVSYLNPIPTRREDYIIIDAVGSSQIFFPTQNLTRTY